MKQNPANYIDTGKRDRRSHITKRLRFEMLMSNLSNMFINIPVENIDQAIESGLRRVVEFLGFEHGALHLENEEGHFTNSHTWYSPEIGPGSMIVLDQRYPRTLKYLKEQKNPINVADLDNPPPELTNPPFDLAEEGLRVKNSGQKSIALIPLIVGGMFVGVLAAGTVRTKKHISVELMNRFRLLGEIFSNALLRKKTRTHCVRPIPK